MRNKWRRSLRLSFSMRSVTLPTTSCPLRTCEVAPGVRLTHVKGNDGTGPDWRFSFGQADQREIEQRRRGRERQGGRHDFEGWDGFQLTGNAVRPAAAGRDR